MIKFLSLCIAIMFAAVPVHAELKIQQVTSKGGITAWLVNEPSIPMISMNIAFKGGSSTDPGDKLGATYLMAGLLEEGAGDMDATDFRRAAEELATSFSFDSSRERISISAEFLTENADESVALLKTAITQPAFDDVAFQRTKAQVESIVSRNQTDPQEIANNMFNEIVFAGHPYAHPFQGTTETIANLTQDDMRETHKRTMTKDRLYVGVVGDISAEDLANMLDDLFGELPEKGADFPQPVSFQATGGTTVVDFDTPQSVALWGHAGIAQDDPDFFAAFVMNRILGGGGFTSRLTEEVREKRGLTYGVYSYIANLDYANFYGGSVSSANDRVGQALDVIKSEWSRMADGGVTDEELDAAKKFMTGSYPLRFDGNGRIANILTYSQTNGFPIDYPQNRNSYVEAVTKDDVARVAKRILKSGDLRFVVVGRPDGVTSTD
jgi:zinc protease